MPIVYIQNICIVACDWHVICSRKNKHIILYSKRCWYCGLRNKLLESENLVIASILT